MRARASIAVLLIALTTAGCALQNPFQGERVHTQADLDARPTSAAMVTRYEEMQQRIRDAFDTEFGRHDWKPSSGRESGCGRDFERGVTGGSTIYLPLWAFTGPITDAQWPRAAQIVTDIIAQYGFVVGGLGIVKPGQHMLNAFDTDLGAHFTLGNVLNTSMQTTTGCHPDPKN